MAKKQTKKVTKKTASKKTVKKKASKRPQIENPANQHYSAVDIKHMVDLFIYNYIENGFKNGRKAAIDAGYAEGSAHVQASRLLNKDNVRKRIAEKKIEVEAELDKALNLNKTQVLAKWVKLGLRVTDAPYRDQLKATEFLARHLGMFNEAGKGDSRSDRPDVANRVRETLGKMRTERRKRGKEST